MRMRVMGFDGVEYIGSREDIARQMHESRFDMTPDLSLSDRIRRTVEMFGDVHGIALTVEGETESALCRSFVDTLIDAGLIHRLG